MANPFHKNLEALLNKVGKQVMNRSKSALQSAKPFSKGGGDLENSVKYEVKKGSVRVPDEKRIYGLPGKQIKLSRIRL